MTGRLRIHCATFTESITGRGQNPIISERKRTFDCSVMEELSMRKIAKARIHVEHFNQQLKQFGLVGGRFLFPCHPLQHRWLLLLVVLLIFKVTFVHKRIFKGSYAYTPCSERIKQKLFSCLKLLNFLNLK